jgi:vancomycin permeability regulator SanA
MRRWIAVAMGVVLAVPLGIVCAGLLAKPAPADVGIVFGSRVEKNGDPSPRLRVRLEAARSLYGSGLVRHLIVSGGMGKEGYDEASVMRSFLVRRGIPDSAIVMDRGGANTRRTSESAARIMRARGWRTADVVTQYFHVVRARGACERHGIRVVGAAVPCFFEPRDLYSTAREAVAIPEYAWNP